MTLLSNAPTRLPHGRFRTANRRFASLTTGASVRSPPSLVETLVCTALLAALGAAVFGSNVVRGGFSNDDWAFAVTAIHAPEPGLLGAFEAFEWYWFRPLAAAYYALTYEAFGANASLHLALLLAIGVLMCASLYVLLRTLTMERLHAGAIAALVLVFPAADATRFWAATAISPLAITLYLLGVVVALSGLGATCRPAFLRHAVAVSLYMASVLAYQIAAGAILLSALLYRLRAPWSSALPRWAVDVVAVALTLALAGDGFYEPRPLSEWPSHAVSIARESWAILALASLPFGEPRTVTVVAFLAALVSAGALVSHLLPAADPARRTLRRWLATAVAAGLAIGAGYLMFVPADPGYHPLAPGQGNRVNALAAIGFVAAVYALVMVAATLVFRGLPSWPAWCMGFAAVAAVVLGTGYANRVAADKAQWESAAEAREHVVARVRAALPKPPYAAVIYTVGHPAHTSPNIPVFAAIWDLSGAVQLEWDDPSLAAYPAFPGTRFSC